MNEIVTACHKLYERGLVSNHDGNITVKIPNSGDGQTFLATPTSFSKGDVTASDLLILDAAGKVLTGRHRVFSEIAFHLEIYRVRPDVQCVVHAHPPIASGFALAGKEIGMPFVPEAIVSLGQHILNTKFISPLDLKIFPEEAARVLAESDAFLIPGNGAWVVGQDVMQTYYRMELLEHIAKQHFYADALGGAKPLAPDLVEELLKRRPKAKPTVASPLPLQDLVFEQVTQLFGDRR